MCIDVIADCQRHAIAATHKYFQRSICLLKVVRHHLSRFSFSKSEISAGPQREREELQRSFLKLFRKIQQNVAARHEIEAREGCSLTEIVLSEHNHCADALVDFIPGVETRKVLLNQLRRDVFQRV